MVPKEAVPAPVEAAREAAPETENEIMVNENFNFMCTVCGKGFNSTNAALKKHTQDDEQSSIFISVMKEVNKLKTSWENEREIQRQEIISLTEQLNNLNNGVSQLQRASTPVPASLPPRPPAPASPPSLPSTSGAPAPSFAAVTRNPANREVRRQGPPLATREEQSQPPTYKPAPR